LLDVVFLVCLFRLRGSAPVSFGQRSTVGAGLAGLSYALGSCWLTSIRPTNKGGPCPPRLASRPLPPLPSASSLRSRSSASTLILRGRWARRCGTSKTQALSRAGFRQSLFCFCRLKGLATEQPAKNLPPASPVCRAR